MDANSSTHRVKQEKVSSKVSLNSSESWNYSLSPAVSVDGHGSVLHGPVLTGSEASLWALSQGCGKQLLEHSVCHTLCAGLAGCIKCQLHLLHLLILGRRHVSRLLHSWRLFLNCNSCSSRWCDVVDAIRHTPSCQGPLSCTFWAMGHLAGSALYSLNRSKRHRVCGWSFPMGLAALLGISQGAVG